MKVTINDREYELKKLTREEARAYIQKDVYVWDSDADDPTKRKLLEAFQTDCDYPFCVLRQNGTGACNFAHCAAVPEEWYVYETTVGSFFHSNVHQDNKKVDHGSEEYCIQKAQELNEHKETTEHPLTYYELTQLLKCFGVDYTHKCNYDSAFNAVHQTCNYSKGEEKENCRGDIVIRYKCGEWMSATRETVWKWWGEEVPNSDVARFVSFMEWDI